MVGSYAHALYATAAALGAVAGAGVGGGTPSLQQHPHQLPPHPFSPHPLPQSAPPPQSAPHPQHHQPTDAAELLAQYGGTDDF